MNLAKAEIHDLNITCSVFQRLLKNTFPTPTATVIAVSVQLHAELAVCIETFWHNSGLQGDYVTP
jgi:hypothetical protein